MMIFLLIYEMCIIVNTSSEDGGSEEAASSAFSPYGGALYDLSSTVYLCNGVLYSAKFIFTSCRCLTSGVAIEPYFIKRNASRYGLDIIFRSVDPEEDRKENKIGMGSYGVESFILSPLCFRTKVRKPHHQHIGLIVLKDSGIKETLKPIAVGQNTLFEDSADQLELCRIVGVHTEDGQLSTTDVEMVLMSSDDCLWRLCVPKIGCSGRDKNIRSGKEFCLARAGNEIPKQSFYEGSAVTCKGFHFGLIVSTGRIRYPQAPLILASMKQFLDQMPTIYESQVKTNSSPKAPVTVLALLNVILTLCVLLKSNRSFL